MMLEKLKTACQDLGLSGKRVLVAVSGGPDSIALLDALVELKEFLRLDFAIAHFNHRQRIESEEEEEFVRSLGKRYGIPVFVGHLSGELPAGVGKEAAMRSARYRFLLDTAKERGYSTVALAHHLDDQAETVLLNLLRGAGTQGLRGMLPKRTIEGIELVRPLLDVSRGEIEDYIRKRGLEFRIDKSNFSSEFLRNKVRLELLPYLEREFNPRIKERLAILAKVLAYDFEFISSIAGKELEKLVIYESEGEVMLSSASFMGLPEALKRQVFRLVIEKVRKDLRQIDFRHYQEFVKMMEDWPVGSVLDLPLGLSIEKRAKGIRFFLRKGDKDAKRDEE